MTRGSAGEGEEICTLYIVEMGSTQGDQQIVWDECSAASKVPGLTEPVHTLIHFEVTLAYCILKHQVCVKFSFEPQAFSLETFSTNLPSRNIYSSWSTSSDFLETCDPKPLRQL